MVFFLLLIMGIEFSLFFFFSFLFFKRKIRKERRRKGRKLLFSPFLFLLLLFSFSFLEEGDGGEEWEKFEISSLKEKEGRTDYSRWLKPRGS